MGDGFLEDEDEEDDENDDEPELTRKDAHAMLRVVTQQLHNDIHGVDTETSESGGILAAAFGSFRGSPDDPVFSVDDAMAVRWCMRLCLCLCACARVRGVAW